MNEEIFGSLADLEKRADEVVERARQQAVGMRAEVERKLKSVADELERDYGLKREDIERELNKRREQIFREFEERMRASMAKLDAARREKVRPVVERVIKAFLEHAK